LIKLFQHFPNEDVMENHAYHPQFQNPPILTKAAPSRSEISFQQTMHVVELQMPQECTTRLVSDNIAQGLDAIAQPERVQHPIILSS
jgi:hypothetical protein